VRGDALRGVGVEVFQRTGVAAGMIGRLGGHRVDQVLLDLTEPRGAVDRSAGRRGAGDR